MTTKNSPDVEELTIDGMAEAIIAHTGISREDMSSFLEDEEKMKAFYSEAMKGDAVERPSDFEKRVPEGLPILDGKGKKVSASQLKRKKAQEKKEEPEPEPGFVTMKSGRRVNLSHVVVDKTDQAFNKGRNNFPVPNPELPEDSYNIVFEMWPELNEEYPCVILPDYRLRAHALFEVKMVSVGPKTRAVSKPKIINRKGYFLLSPVVSDSDVRQMREYLLKHVSEEREVHELASSMIGGD